MSFKIIGLGEVLWDLLPDGPQLGGAPTNFAYHANTLGAQALVITRVGSDYLGREIFSRFKDLDLRATMIQTDDEVPTGTVAVTLNGNGVPHFIINENVAWDRLVVTPQALEAARNADAICFGSLAQRDQRSRATIQQLVAATPSGALRVFDINLRQKFYSREVIEQSLRLANVIKLNDSELPILADMFGLSKSPQQQIEDLAKAFELRLAVLTRGPQGSSLYERGRWSEQPAPAVTVVDTVGAGDSFTAALVVGLLSGMDLDEIHALAAEVAGYVCGHVGATPVLSQSLRSKFIKIKRHDRNAPNNAMAKV
jgi:fructokinase